MEDSLNVYSTKLDPLTIIQSFFDGTFGGEGGPEEEPQIVSFTAQTGLNEGEVEFSFSLSSIQDEANVEIKGWKQGTIPTITTPAEFNASLLPDYSYQTIINGPTYEGNFPDIMPESGVEYGYYILICNPDGKCDLSEQENATSKEGTGSPTSPIVVFSAIPSPEPAGITFSYDVQNLSAGSTLAIKGWRQGSIPPLNETTFNTTGGEDFEYSTNPSGTSVIASFDDFMPEANNKTYTFYLMACNPGYPCTLSTMDATTQGSTPNGTIKTYLDPMAIETIYDYDIDKCFGATEGDIPDMPIRAVKLSNGTIWLTRTHSKSRLMIGTNFNSLTPNCTVVFQSTLVPESIPALDVTTFAHKEWISAIYREPADSKIHMMVHNEFHDPNLIADDNPNPSIDAPCKSGVPIPGNPCNYFSLTYASAPDIITPTTNMFQKPSTWQTDPNSFIIGTSHLQWPSDPDPSKEAPVFGLPMTTNIIKRGSYYYFMNHELSAVYNTNATNGTCVARTQNLNDPTSWRFWDGSSYSLRMGDPYTGDSDGTACAFVSKPQIDNMAQTVTWNSYLKKYISIAGIHGPTQPYVCGYYFSTSDDLIHWTMRQLLWEVPSPTGPCSTGQTEVKAYASLIDHGPTGTGDPNDPNFEITGKAPYLYYTQWHSGLNRDIERIKITFCDSAQEVCP